MSTLKLVEKNQSELVNHIGDLATRQKLLKLVWDDLTLSSYLFFGSTQKSLNAK